jgi:hypothetical protein
MDVDATEAPLDFPVVSSGPGVPDLPHHSVVDDQILQEANIPFFCLNCQAQFAHDEEKQFTQHVYTCTQGREGGGSAGIEEMKTGERDQAKSASTAASSHDKGRLAGM